MIYKLQSNWGWPSNEDEWKTKREFDNADEAIKALEFDASLARMACRLRVIDSKGNIITHWHPFVVLRPYKPSDLEPIIKFTTETNAFKPFEVEALREVLEEASDICMVAVHWLAQDIPMGVCYYALEGLTESTWCLWWIVVDKGWHKTGCAKEMIDFMEKDVKIKGGKQIIIETGSNELMAAARRFYTKMGYENHAVIKKYYSDTEDKVIFRKEL